MSPIAIDSLPPDSKRNNAVQASSPSGPLSIIVGDRVSLHSEDDSYLLTQAVPALRPEDRQSSALSLDTTSSQHISSQETGLLTSNPFSTPAIEQVNPFSPPASVVNFSMSGEHTPRSSSAIASGASGQAYAFPDLHQRISAISSVQTSLTDLRGASASGGIREAFASPQRRPLTILQPAASSSPNVPPKRSKRERPRSTMLSQFEPLQKPWLKTKDSTARLAYFITYGVMLLGFAASAVRIYFAWKAVPLLGRMCLVLDEEFSGSDLDTEGIWQREADMGGFGYVASLSQVSSPRIRIELIDAFRSHSNGEFEMTTTSTNNSFIRNNNLYLLPTLTSSVIGQDAIFDGYTFNLTGCTNTNLTACGAVSNRTAGTVINPVMSARISTRGKKSIRYGRVEVRAKLPLG